MKEIKRQLNKVRAVSCPWTENLNTIEMPILPRKVCSFNPIPVRVQQDDPDMLVLKYSRPSVNRSSSTWGKESKQSHCTYPAWAPVSVGATVLGWDQPTGRHKRPRACPSQCRHTPHFALPSTLTDVGAAVRDSAPLLVCSTFLPKQSMTGGHCSPSWKHTT